MKLSLSVDSFLSSFKKSTSSTMRKNKNKNKSTRSELAPGDASFASSSSSSEEEFANAAASLVTTRSVLPAKSVLTDGLALHELFNAVDRDGDGKITQRELEAVLRRLVPAAGGTQPSAKEVARMVAEVDRDGDGCISLEDFRVLEAALAAAAAAGGEGTELREAFAVFDADGDGKISAEELLGVFMTLGDGECTIEDCRRMIGGVDSDGDGFVCFEDFVRMMDGQG